MDRLAQVLADGTRMPGQILATAHGRAASLWLARSEAGPALEHLAQADRLCGPPCADAPALAVLRARLALLQGDAPRAAALADAALALPALAAATGVAPGAPQPAAERANALRVRGLAQLVLGRPAEAAVSGSAALEIDRALGLVDRVAPDLQLLARAHEQLGQEDLARHYQRLAERAEQARAALRGSGRSF